MTMDDIKKCGEAQNIIWEACNRIRALGIENKVILDKAYDHLDKSAHVFWEAGFYGKQTKGRYIIE